MKKTYWSVVFFQAIVCFEAESADFIQLKTFDRVSRLSVQLDDSIPVDWKNSIHGFSAFFKGVHLKDLKLSEGQISEEINRLEKLEDPRMKGVQLIEKMNGIELRGFWRFPVGQLALAHPRMEVFTYRESSPSQYVVDFWIKEGPTAIEEENDLQRKRSNETFAQYKKKRAIASSQYPQDKKIQELNRFSNTCEKPLSEENDIFLEFYPVHQKVDFSRWFPITTADEYFHYSVPPKEDIHSTSSKENQYIRLALNLSSQGKLGLVVRILDFFEAEFPHSRFREEMKFLRANSLIRLGFHQEAEKILLSLVHRSKKTQVGLHSALFLSSKLMKENSSLAALEKFLWLIKNYSESKWIWIFHLGVAECFYYLKNTERSLKEYQWVVDNASDTSKKAEASFRMGDIFLENKKYEQSLMSYFHTKEYFKSEYSKYPSFQLNLAESYYQLGQFLDAQSAYSSFLKDFPYHPEGWRATFRLGEISGRLAQTPEDMIRSRSWYYETINRYPSSVGVTLARIRLMPCIDQKELGFEAQDRFFNLEAKNFDGKNKVRMARFEDFKVLAHIRTLISHSPLSYSLDGAIHEINLSKDLKLKKILIKIAHHLLGKYILSLISSNKKFEALKIYVEKSKKIPNLDEKYDVEYLLPLSQAASELNLIGFSQEISKLYQELKNNSPINQSKESKRGELLLESLTHESDKNYLDAKAIWIISKKSENKQEENKIINLLNKLSNKTKYEYEKNIILGLINEKNLNIDSAIKFANRAQLLSRDLKVDQWLAQLQEKSGRLESALNIYKNLINQIKENKKTDINEKNEDIALTLGLQELLSVDQIVVAQGRILEKQKKWGEAALVYSQAIEDGYFGGKILYYYARDLLKTGKPIHALKAEKVLTKIKTLSSDKYNEFWKILAEQILANKKQRELFIKDAKEGKKNGNSDS